MVCSFQLQHFSYIHKFCTVSFGVVDNNRLDSFIAVSTFVDGDRFEKGVTLRGNLADVNGGAFAVTGEGSLTFDKDRFWIEDNEFTGEVGTCLALQ